MKAEDQAIYFFKSFIGSQPFDLKQIAQSGSSRVNFVADAHSEKFVVTYNDNPAENEAFFYFSGLFSSLKLNTPKIFKISPDRKWYIQEYLGDFTLSEIIEREGFNDRVKELVKKSLTALYALQSQAKGKVDFAKTFEYRQYDRLTVTQDLYYFKNFMADTAEVRYHKSSLLKEFDNIARTVGDFNYKTLMLRDFQARNIMVDHHGEVFFIDYQSAMEGPAMYDAVSFLFQAKANFPEDYKAEMLEFYISKFPEAERPFLRQSVGYIILLRYLQVLGAYGFRGLFQRKPHFVASIDKGLANAKNLAESWSQMEHYPELKNLILNLNLPQTRQKIAEISENKF